MKFRKLIIIFLIICMVSSTGMGEGLPTNIIDYLKQIAVQVVLKGYSEGYKDALNGVEFEEGVKKAKEEIQQFVDLLENLYDPEGDK